MVLEELVRFSLEAVCFWSLPRDEAVKFDWLVFVAHEKTIESFTFV